MLYFLLRKIYNLSENIIMFMFIGILNRVLKPISLSLLYINIKFGNYKKNKRTFMILKYSNITCFVIEITIQ